MPHEEEDDDDDEDYEGDVSNDHNAVSLVHEDSMDITSEDVSYDMSPLNISNLSEEQVIAHLTQSSRHVHFQLPRGDQDRLNSPQSASENTVKDGQRHSYVAPLPPSSPLRQSRSQDPLAKVSEYIDNVLRPRGGECTDVEALGLSMLIQSSVNRTSIIVLFAAV